MAGDPDPERVKERARHRRQEQTEHVENILDQTEAMPGEQKYPTTSEELAAEHADQPLDLPNETESLGSVFDRLKDERFESVEDAREALHAAITGPASRQRSTTRNVTSVSSTTQHRRTPLTAVHRIRSACPTWSRSSFVEPRRSLRS